MFGCLGVTHRVAPSFSPDNCVITRLPLVQKGKPLWITGQHATAPTFRDLQPPSRMTRTGKPEVPICSVDRRERYRLGSVDMGGSGLSLSHLEGAHNVPIPNKRTVQVRPLRTQVWLESDPH